MTTIAKPKLGLAQAELTPLQLRFVEEWVANPASATQAALRAGYSESEAGSYASKLLKNPKIKAAIDEIKHQAAERIGLTEERILRELCKIAFANVGDLISAGDLSSLSREQLSSLTAEVAIREIDGKVKGKEVKVKPIDKANILLQLGKHLGMFKEKVEVSGELTLEQLVEASMKETPELKEQKE